MIPEAGRARWHSVAAPEHIVVGMPTAAEIVEHPDFVEFELVGPMVDEEPTLVEHSPQWARLYRDVDADIRAALGSMAIDVEHVGSTAVPMMVAKPIIDVDLTVPDPTAEDDYIPALLSLGYYFQLREPRFHEHRFLKLFGPRVNVHAFGPDSPELVRHRIMRDWLTNNPAERETYTRAKQAALGSGSTQEYNERKSATIREIYDRAFRGYGLFEAAHRPTASPEWPF